MIGFKGNFLVRYDFFMDILIGFEYIKKCNSGVLRLCRSRRRSRRIEQFEFTLQAIYECHRPAGISKVAPEIDCTQCANCCKKNEPLLSEHDIEKFTEGLKISVNEFKSNSLKGFEDEFGGKKDDFQ